MVAMLNLAEYRNKTACLADLLPWAALVAPGIILNKDGSFQRTFRFRGPDLESATEAELIGFCARVNNVLKRLGSGWALFFEANRSEAETYPVSRFPDPASWLVDEERRAAFAEARQGAHFESRLISSRAAQSCLWKPAGRKKDGTGGWNWNGSPRIRSGCWTCSQASCPKSCRWMTTRR
jgi:type IV secretory pathway VirB4 component